METVSTIMPVYNAERYLCEAIESVLKQTYSKFELLLINDNSMDRSKKMHGIQQKGQQNCAVRK